MSLKVWLPLDGDLRNLGASDIEVVNNGATVNDAGKIGKCYYFDGGSYVSGTYKITENISFCCWAYFPSVPNGKHLFDARTPNGVGYQPMYISTGGIQIGGSGSTFPSIGYSWVANTWYHICVTHDSSSGKLYINGQLISSTAASGFNGETGNFTLCSRCNQSNYCTAKLNDVRIYNHCLSAAEVHEIAMGLVLHYKLDLPNPNLAINTNTNNVSTNAWALSMQTGDKTNTIEIMDSIPVLIITRGSTERSGWLYLSYTNFSRSLIKINTTYTVSFDVWASNSGIINLTGLLNGNATNYMTNNTTNIQNTVIANQWNHILLQCTTKSSFEDITIGSQVIYMSPSSSLCGTGTVLKFKNMKLEEGNKETPWCPHSSDLLYTILGYNNNVVEDSSGYNHNGTLVSPLSPDTTSPRYNAAYQFSGNIAHRIYYNTTNFNYTDNFSWACWIKANHTGTAAQYLFTVGRADAGGRGYGIYNVSDSAIRLLFGNTYYEITITKNNWHHIAFTKSENTIKIYKDGTLYSTNTFSGTLPTYSDGNGLGIGCFHYTSGDIYPAYGSISDFRIYCTPLLDNDIKMLYNVGMKVDNLGGVHSFELEENNQNKITKTGILKIKNIIDSNYKFHDSTGWSYSSNGDNNSCASFVKVDFSPFLKMEQPISILIEGDLNWSNITPNGNGTFRSFFQGANYKIGASGAVWEGANYAQPGLTTTSAMTTNPTGSMHFSVTHIIPASWFNTYEASQVSFRTDYATGTITLSNLSVTLVKGNAKLNSQYLSTSNFIEI